MAGDRKAGRAGAACDIAVWLAIIIAAMLITQTLGRSGMASGLTMRVAAPLQMLLLFGVTSALIWRRGETWRSLGLTRPRSAGRTVALVVGGYIAVIMVNAALLLAVLPALGVKLPNFAAIGTLQGHPWTYANWLALAWASAAVGEELEFRAFLLSRLDRLFGGGPASIALALVLQAAAFGLGHVYQGLGGVLATGALGLVLGGVFLAGRRNLVACIVLHGLIDTVSLTILFLGLGPAAAARM